MPQNPVIDNELDRPTNESSNNLILNAVLLFLGCFFPGTFAKRIVAAVLIAVETPVKDIAFLLSMGKSTVYDLKKAIMNASSIEDITSLFQMKPGCGRKPKTGGLFDSIKKTIDSETYTCLRDIQKMIENTFGIVLSIASTARLMARIGIKRLKAASFPANADPSKQKEFYEKLRPLMQQAMEGKVHLLFMDVAHFVMGCDFLGYIYGSVRRFVHSHSGRQRYNVLGALDFVTKKVHTITNTTYLTATEVMAMMRKVCAYYGKGTPIRIVLDNARYQKCQAVKVLLNELKKEYDFDFVYLPSYSPNLNLIERVWRHVKTEMKKSFIKDFPSFCSNIDSIIAATETTAKAQMDTLIGEEVQLYDSVIPVDAHTFVMPKKAKAA